MDVSGTIVNSITRQTMPLLNTWRMQGRLTELPEPIQIPDDYVASPLVVLAVRRQLSVSHMFTPDAGRRLANYHHRATKTSYFVFRDRAAFNRYAEDVASDVAGYVLRNTPEAEIALPIIDAALALHANDLMLHALRVGRYGEPNPLAEATAEKFLRTDRERQQLRELIPLLRTHEGHEPSVVQWLDYEDGIAEGGGLDVSDAARTFTALKSVYDFLKAEVVKSCRFLSPNEVPPFRVAQLQPGSARIGISVDIPRKPVLDRVVRYFAVEALRDVLRGTISPELDTSAEFQRTLDALVHPTPETRLLQRTDKEKEATPVIHRRVATAELKPERDFRVLAVVEGAYDLVRRIELRLSPEIREVVPRDDNGRGQVPLGVGTFLTGNFIFRPCIADLVRYTDGVGRHKFYLQNFEVITASSTFAISMLPSTVVVGAYIQPSQPIVISVSNNNEISLAGEAIRTSNATTLDSANQFLNAYQAAIARIEMRLAAIPHAAVWIPPVRRRPPSVLARLLTVLASFGGRARISDVIAEMEQRFAASSRIRVYVRREVINNDTLLGFNDIDDDVLELAPEGRLHAQIIDAVMGWNDDSEDLDLPPISET